MEDKFVINNVLCYLNSARKDFSPDTLIETALSFYSHEGIKRAKEAICNFLKKDILWRRDPDKKGKDLKDVVEYLNEVVTSKIIVKFVTDSHKCMPPVDFEKIGSLLSSLAEQVSIINDVLPKILDIKTEVINTADSVRDIKMDVCDLRKKFSSAILGMEEVTKDVTLTDINFLGEVGPLRIQRELDKLRNRDEALEGIREVTKSRNGVNGRRRTGGRDCAERDVRPDVEGLTTSQLQPADLSATVQRSTDEAEKRKATGAWGRRWSGGGVGGGGIVCSSPAPPVTDRGGGAVSKARFFPASPDPASQGPPTLNRRGQRTMEDGWIRQDKRNNNNTKKVRSTGVICSGKCGGGTMKAVSRSVDVFIGRVSTEVDSECLKTYIIDVCKVQPFMVSELKIRAEGFKAFKVCIKLANRETLFNPELWPEDTVVDKFYNRSKRSNEANTP